MCTQKKRLFRDVFLSAYNTFCQEKKENNIRNSLSNLETSVLFIFSDLEYSSAVRQFVRFQELSYPRALAFV